jgi:hypothetical protein
LSVPKRLTRQRRPHRAALPAHAVAVSLQLKQWPWLWRWKLQQPLRLSSFANGNRAVSVTRVLNAAPSRKPLLQPRVLSLLQLLPQHLDLYVQRHNHLCWLQVIRFWIIVRG